MVFSEWARVVPVSKAIGPMLRVAANHSHESEGKEQADENELATREPELCLAVPADSKYVNKPISRRQKFSSRLWIGGGDTWINPKDKTLWTRDNEKH